MGRTILVSGGAGYVGSVLVPLLIKKGYTVHVFDTFWYWDTPQDYTDSLNLTSSPLLKLYKGDLRNIADIQKALHGVDTVIQLACISNDPSSDLDPAFTHSINYDGNINIIDESKKAGVKRFIYASSSSVYGIKEVPDVTEEQSLEPLTQYSKLKVEIEHYLLHVLDDHFKGMIVRPSTVCGYSPRQRLDVVVNIFVDFALTKGKIKIFGGDQLRPNIHIQDMAELYILLTEIDINKVNKKIYNAGWENLKVSEIAHLVKGVIGNVELEVVPTDDNRSYHVSSKKIKEEIGFITKHTVKDAILDLKHAFDQKKIVNSQDDKYHNIRRMKKILGL